MVQLVSLIFIHWIVIYPVDSAIRLLNNYMHVGPDDLGTATDVSINSQIVRSEKSLVIGIKSPDSAVLKIYLKKKLLQIKKLQ